MESSTYHTPSLRTNKELSPFMSAMNILVMLAVSLTANMSAFSAPLLRVAALTIRRQRPAAMIIPAKMRRSLFFFIM